jgi:hypothetical protein
MNVFGSWAKILGVANLLKGEQGCIVAAGIFNRWGARDSVVCGSGRCIGPSCSVSEYVSKRGWEGLSEGRTRH